jgi:hypothetical protein
MYSDTKLKPAQQRDLLTRRWRNVVAQRQKESTFQITLVALLRWALRPDVLMRHTPNGEHRDRRIGAKLRAMGVLAGVADLQFDFAEIDELGRKCRCVLHLELKRFGGRQTAEQAAFQLAVKLLGDEYHVVHSVDEAIAILGERGLLRRDVEVCGRRW